MSKSSGVNIPKDYTFKVGGDGSTIHVDSDLDNIHIKEIAPVTVNSNIAVTEPIVTQSTSNSDSKAAVDLKLEPVKVSSDSTSAIDIKPLAVDSCQTLKIAPLPPIRMSQPYSQHFGITFMGIELWGVNLSGQSETHLYSPPKPQHFSVQAGAPCDCGCHHRSHEPEPDLPRPRSGLRVRVK